MEETYHNMSEEKKKTKRIPKNCREAKKSQYNSQ